MSRSSLCNVTLTVLCAFVLVGSASATGSGGFRIEDYIPQKFTDLEWKINGGLGISGSNSDSDRESLPGVYISERGESTSRGRSFSFGSELMYRYETVERVLELGGSISGDFNSTDSEGSNYRSDSLGLNRSNEQNHERFWYRFTMTPTLEARTYLINDLFAGVSGSGSIQHEDTPTDEGRTEGFRRYQYYDYIRNSYYYSVVDYELHIRDCNAALALSPGWGRVYEGQYAATALYMIDELRKGGLLERVPSKKEMLELTEIIYQNRMAHEVDHRLAKMDALNAVTKYLTDIGAIAETGNFSYVLIQDVWDFFPHSSRNFGMLVKVGIGWEYDYNKYERSRDEYSTLLEYQYHIDSADVIDTLQDYQGSTVDKTTIQSELDNSFLTFGVEYYRPVSMRWQWDSFAELYYYVHAEGLRGRYHSSPGPRYGRPPGIQLQSAPGIDNYYQFHLGSYGTYIYSSRTNLQIYGVLTYDHYEMPTEPGSGSTRTTKSWDGTLGSTLTYRMSIPTALTISAYYRDQGQQNVSEEDYRTDTGRWSFSAAISHYLY